MVSAAALCPIRIEKGRLETFMVKRATWNNYRNKPMRYPGEWTFSGGKEEAGDRTLYDTGCREFREELGYQGEIIPLATYSTTGDAALDTVDFYLVYLQEEVPKEKFNQELSAAAWLSPIEALRRIYGKTDEEDRQFPHNTVRVLELLEEIV